MTATLADLRSATAKTQAAIDRKAPAAEVIAAAEAEAGVLHDYEQRPGARAVLKAGIA